MSANPPFSLRPVFIGWNVLATRFSLQLYIATLCGAAGGIVTTLRDRSDNIWPPFIFFGAIGFLTVAPLGIYFFNKWSYARTEYRFYPDRLEFEEGFFVVKKKTIMFRDVEQVALQKSVPQQLCNLGTVDLATMVIDPDDVMPRNRLRFTSAPKSGAQIQDIADPDATFATIQKLVDAARHHRADNANAETVRSAQQVLLDS